ncbi:hypothetical protein TWF225_010558 [Orbilia oligospora]|uniref:DNA2/NAM7 helicase helicase domain-containing protein n=1 Tax=Orbilia oligospora TaxID=2813651 RepID=A0A7C8PKX1_ORBOL|nr:hypothetical protein TWF751_006974 [Orbilia oligospora]KAF3171705.1 hypothetical protein TWF225_010558 [Orbilia oligospora]TGJ74372.1 hypothetical protein EYR41_001385 [Orbilia oligospora]
MSTKFWFSVPSLKAGGQRFRLDRLKLALRSYHGLEKYVSVQPFERGRKFFISFELTKDSILQSDLTESPSGTVLSLIIDPELTELTAPKGLDKESSVVKIFYALNKATILDLCFGEVLSTGDKIVVSEFFKHMKIEKVERRRPDKKNPIFDKSMSRFFSLRDYYNIQSTAAKWEHDFQTNRIRDYFKGKAWVRLLDDDREIEIHMRWTGDPKEKIRLRDEQEFDLPCELREVMWVEPVENTRSRNLILKNLQRTIEAAKDKQSRVDLCGIILGFNPLANTKPCSREVIEQLEKFPLEDEQRSAALMALSPVDDNEPTLLTTVRGGPSTGKTYLSSVVCKVALASKLNSRILVCAPTNISLEALIEAMAEFVEIKSRRGDVVYLQSRIPSTRMEHDHKNEIVAAIVAKTKLAKQREGWMDDHINDRLTPRYAECTNKKLEGPLREVEELIEKKIWSNTLLAFTTLESALKVPLSFDATMLVIEEAGRATSTNSHH